jgi:hypothetical protein
MFHLSVRAGSVWYPLLLSFLDSVVLHTRRAHVVVAAETGAAKSAPRILPAQQTAAHSVVASVVALQRQKGTGTLARRSERIRHVVVVVVVQSEAVCVLHSCPWQAHRGRHLVAGAYTL